MNIRNLFIIFLFFSIVSCISDNQNRQTDIERLQLNGQVKSYSKTIHRSSNELNDTIKTTFKERHRELILFDKNGNIIEEISFKKNGERYKKWISVYNSKGDEIEKFEITTSTIARGIAVGDELEYADEVTLGRSIINRIPFEQSIKG